MVNINPTPYSKHNLDGPASYNGGTFQSANAAVAGCSGQSCNSLAAKSVFAEPVNNCAASAGLPALASNGIGALSSSLGKLAGGLSKMIGGRKRKGKSRKGKKSKGKGRKGKSTKGKSRKGKSTKSKRSKVHRKQTKRRQHSSKKRRRYHRTKKVMHGGAQMMSNICHSAGHSIGPVASTSSKPTEVGLAAGHFTPYTKTQNN